MSNADANGKSLVGESREIWQQPTGAYGYNTEWNRAGSPLASWYSNCPIPSVAILLLLPAVVRLDDAVTRTNEFGCYHPMVSALFVGNENPAK